MLSCQSRWNLSNICHSMKRKLHFSKRGVTFQTLTHWRLWHFNTGAKLSTPFWPQSPLIKAYTYDIKEFNFFDLTFYREKSDRFGNKLNLFTQNSEKKLNIWNWIICKVLVSNCAMYVVTLEIVLTLKVLLDLLGTT